MNAMTMTTPQTRYRNAGVPTPAGLSGGAFAPEPPRPESATQLQSVAVLPGLNRTQATAYVEDLAAHIDAANLEAPADPANEEELILDAEAAGKAQAYAEVLAFVLSPDVDGDFGSAGEDLLNFRREGILVELGAAHEVSSLKRGFINAYAQRSAAQAFSDAEEASDIPDVAALHFARATAFQDIAMDLGDAHTDFEGK